MSERPIIIKRIKKVAGGHHGGAWKIAYADFVTAMMAFFLLMWLLSSVNKAKLEGISEYFTTPLEVALQGGKEGRAQEIDRLFELKQLSAESEEKPPEIDQAEIKQLQELKEKLEELIETSALLRQFKDQLILDLTRDGLRIQIVDEQNRAMFDLGSAVLKPYTVTILHEIGKALNEVPNRISLAGHTDSKPFPGRERGYSNWELSSDRANASRREMINGGLAENKVVRVVGLSDAVLFDKGNPLDSINRRMSILVMTKAAEQKIYEDGGILNVTSIAGFQGIFQAPGEANQPAVNPSGEQASPDGEPPPSPETAQESAPSAVAE
ncbi:MAG: flagellar motor protein MotB [Thiotrichales bacterium]